MVMKKGELSIRRSQLVTAFGPGAIFDFGQESLIALDIGKWPTHKCPVIRLPRLERRVGARSGFWMPPVPQGAFDKNPPRVPFYRFPRWLFCPSCRRLAEWKPADEKAIQQDETYPICVHCPAKSVLAPMRFVIVCRQGHLGDVDWYRWAHSRASQAETGSCSRETSKLFFKTRTDVGGGIEALYVECSECHASRDFEDLLNSDRLRKAGFYCPGRQPWQYWNDRVKCDEDPQAVQRGASNVYFPMIASALDIPVGSSQPAETEEPSFAEHHLFSMLKQVADSVMDPRNAPEVMGLAEGIARDSNAELQEVIDAVAPLSDATDEATQDSAAKKDLLAAERELVVEEWPALNTEMGARDKSDPILIRRSHLSDKSESEKVLAKYVDRVMLVERLREVRTLVGFTRYEPSINRVPPDLYGHAARLPGIEVYGEGIFLVLREDAIADWQKSQAAALDARLGPMEERRATQTGLASLLQLATPRLVLLHTLSHLLIRQLCFECGYDSASMRERIYSAEPGEVGGPMAGILIYTADSDAEGSLGGLVRQGESDRFAVTLLAALNRARWCSSDPICRELPGQGLGGLNRAACHACTLVSETSCSMHNVLLDREPVIGSGGVGFFSEVIDELDREVAV